MRPIRGTLACLGIWSLFCLQSAADPTSQMVPTGESVTPFAVAGTVLLPLNPGLAQYSDHSAGQAVAAELSPDGTRLVVLTSGFNRLSDSSGKPDKAASSEWAFVYDVSQGRPRQLQALPVANADQGLAWNPDGHAFYVSGGVDDVIHVFASSGGPFAEVNPPIRLAHAAGLGIADPTDGAVPPERRGHETETQPMVAGIAVDPTGKLLIAANFANDSVTLVDLGRSSVAAEFDLRPGKSHSETFRRRGRRIPRSGSLGRADQCLCRQPARPRNRSCGLVKGSAARDRPHQARRPAGRAAKSIARTIGSMRRSIIPTRSTSSISRPNALSK